MYRGSHFVPPKGEVEGANGNFSTPHRDPGRSGDLSPSGTVGWRVVIEIGGLSSKTTMGVVP